MLALTAVYALRPLAVAAVTLGHRGRVARAGTRALHRLSRRLRGALGLRVTVEGALPDGACVVCPNHVSALDVVVLASVADAVFVSRGDVRDWTGIGPLSRLGGTVYVDRARKRDTAQAAEEIGALLDRGLRVVVFLEGRAGTGDGVLPFRSSLLAPACRRELPCVAATVRYSVPDDPHATVATDVAWADDVPFGASVMRMLRLRTIDARVTFHPPRSGAERKSLAAALESDCRAGLR